MLLILTFRVGLVTSFRKPVIFCIFLVITQENCYPYKVSYRKPKASLRGVTQGNNYHLASLSGEIPQVLPIGDL